MAMRDTKGHRIKKVNMIIFCPEENGQFPITLKSDSVGSFFWGKIGEIMTNFILCR